MNVINYFSHNAVSSIILNFVNRNALQADFPEMVTMMTLYLHNHDVTIGCQREGHEIANHIIAKAIING